MRRQYANDDRELINGDKLPAVSGWGDFGNVHGRQGRGQSDTQASDQSVDDKWDKIIGVASAESRNDKESGSEDQRFFSSQPVGQHTGQNGAENTSHQRTAHCPPLQRRQGGNIEIKLIKRFCPAYYHPVIAKKEATHGRNQRQKQQIFKIEFGRIHLKFFETGIYGYGQLYRPNPVKYPW